MYDRILNPDTGRFVNTRGKLGKRIIKNYLNMLGGTTQIESESEEPKNLKYWIPYATDEQKNKNTKPKFKVGDRVVVEDIGVISSLYNPTVEKKSIYYGTIIYIPDKGTLVYDNDLEERAPPEVWNDNCECHIDDINSGSVWFEADNERKYFVHFDYPENHIDLYFENSLKNFHIN